MGTVVCNVAKGRMVEYYNRVRQNDPAGCSFIVEPVAGVATDAQLTDIDTVDVARVSYSTLGARVGAGEYIRVELFAADLDPLPAPNDALNRYDISLPDTLHDKTVSNMFADTTRAAVYYAPSGLAGGDTTWIPLMYADFVAKFNTGVDFLGINFSSLFLQES